eukprot:scaffold15459_cov72-Phaeocystis_antarctica.AAC.1
MLVTHRAGRHPVAKASGVGGEVGGGAVELLEVVVVAREATVVRLGGAAVAVVRVQRPHNRGVRTLPVWRAIGRAERRHEVVGAAIRRLVVCELLQPSAVHGTHAVIEDGLLRRERHVASPTAPLVALRAVSGHARHDVGLLPPQHKVLQLVEPRRREGERRVLLHVGVHLEGGHLLVSQRHCRAAHLNVTKAVLRELRRVVLAVGIAAARVYVGRLRAAQIAHGGCVRSSACRSVTLAPAAQRSPVSRTTPAMFWPKSKTCAAASPAGTCVLRGARTETWRVGSMSADDICAAEAAEVAATAWAQAASSKPGAAQPASAAAARASELYVTAEAAARHEASESSTGLLPTCSCSRSCGGAARQAGCEVPGGGPHDHQPLPSATPSAAGVPGVRRAVRSYVEYSTRLARGVAGSGLHGCGAYRTGVEHALAKVRPARGELLVAQLFAIEEDLGCVQVQVKVEGVRVDGAVK